MGGVFIGSDALRARKLTGHQLRTYYRAIYPDVYVDRFAEPSFDDKAYAAWLWSQRRATVAGLAAAALHGSPWIDDVHPVELIWRNPNPPSGVLTRNERLQADEITRVDGIPVTTSARTAFDLGRHLPRNDAVARLDALMWASPFSREDVRLLAKRYPRARGLTRLRTALPLVDGGAESPRETRLRLLFIDAGFPKPTTQIPVIDERGRLVKVFDMGWKAFKVAAEYDGGQHQTNRSRYVKDIRALPKVQRLGWIVIRAIKEDRDDEIVRRTWDAMVSRGWKP